MELDRGFAVYAFIQTVMGADADFPAHLSAKSQPPVLRRFVDASRFSRIDTAEVRIIECSRRRLRSGRWHAGAIRSHRYCGRFTPSAAFHRRPNPWDSWKRTDMTSDSFKAADMQLQVFPTAPERLTPGTEIKAAQLWSREDGGEVVAVWEMTPGTLTDVQGNEAFVILSGRARIDFPDGRSFEAGSGEAIVIAPGDVCSFTALETVRKFVTLRTS